MNKKYQKLAISIALDCVGNLSYIVPGLGESMDFIWAPLSAFLMTRLYKGNEAVLGAVLSFIEEGIPATDIIPSFTIMWVYTYLIKNNKEEEANVGLEID